jgi:membrane associated rhomboid family serine protease
VRLLDRLERVLGPFAIRDLVRYIIGLNLAVYLMAYAYPASNIFGRLALDPARILQGEVWRLFTYIFIPPPASVLWIFFILYFMYIIGSGLEQEWGSFRFNAFYLCGMIGTTVGAFLAGQGATAFYLNLSLFLAFAAVYPEYEILLFFVLPVKVKYLAWLNWAFFAFAIVTEPLPQKVAALASVANYFLFFGRDIATGMRDRGATYQRRKPFRAVARAKTTIHRCATCGMTENDDPLMDFRFCSTCEGDFEYCMPHLKAHEHVVAKK